MQLIEVSYIGRCKDKGRGSQAFGWVNGAWSVIFPEAVLRTWFDDDAAAGEASTLYATLGIKQGDPLEAIRAGYRRMALQWHPDRCKDPNAHEQFLRVQEAYDILSNPIKRGKYDAGLKLQATLQVQPTYIKTDPYGYRSPLKCGSLLLEGNQSGKWFVAKQILAWEDIVRGNKILVASWPMGATQPMETWI